MTTTFIIDGKKTEITQSEGLFLFEYFIMLNDKIEVAEADYYSLIKKGVMRKYATSDVECFPTLKGYAIINQMAEKIKDWRERSTAQLKPTFIG